MKNFKQVVYFIIFAILIYSCKKKEENESVEPIPVDEILSIDETPYILEYGNLPAPDIADDNELTIKGVELGRMLFYDTKLSKDGSMSCATCHIQENAFSDPERFSTGVEGLLGGRQAMAVFNMAWNTNEFFWDGRAHLLRDQSILPIQDPLEMNETLENVISKLTADQNYKDKFMLAFGSDEITSLNISLALEQFMNTIVSFDSKYDRFLVGSESLTDSEERGRVLFFAEYNPSFPATSGADCAHCHSGANFENDKYMNNGLDSDANISDDGRENASSNTNDKGKFKVTSLRNIEVTGPYMHDGRFTTLEEVIDHYNSGLSPSATIDQALEYTRTSGGLMLTQQDKDDLVAFLKTLTDNTMLTDEKFSDPF